MKRERTWTLKEILGELIESSRGGSPADYIDESTARIVIRHSKGKPQHVVVIWVDEFESNEERERYWEEQNYKPT